MKLYNFPFSPNSKKVRAVAYELDIELDYVFVDLISGESRTPAFMARNPNGRAPVLEDGDLVLWESNAICAYLATGTELCPSDRRARAEIDRWLAWQLAHLGPAISKVAFERIVKKLRNQTPLDEAAIAKGTEEFATFGEVLDRALAGRPYVTGRLSIADFALACHVGVAETCGLDVARFPNVSAWVARVAGRESMKRADADARASMAARQASRAA